MKQRFEEGKVPVPDNTVASLFAFINTQLTPVYGSDEARAMGAILLQHYAGISRAVMLSGTEVRVHQSELIHIYNAVLRLKEQEPLQYIIGETEFYGMRFRVGPSVLIPRPETEELVDMIIRENRQPHLSVLDVGTGSGCIAVSLAKHLPDAIVYACDISSEALNTAGINAGINNVSVNLPELNFLDPQTWDQLPSVHLLVSNPPYIKQSEAQQMAPHVTEHEPHLALFVPDENALIFYNAIAAFGKEKLFPGGKIYVEINASLGPETAEIFTRKGYDNVSLLKDINGKDRFIRVIKG